MASATYMDRVLSKSPLEHGGRRLSKSPLRFSRILGGLSGSFSETQRTEDAISYPSLSREGGLWNSGVDEVLGSICLAGNLAGSGGLSGATTMEEAWRRQQQQIGWKAAELM